MIFNMVSFKKFVKGNGIPEGSTIVTTNGCFDILHAGHVKMLEHARGMGTVLVVGLNSDSSVRKNKGYGRPLVPSEQRATMLAGLRSVDHVVIFEEETPEEFIRIASPDVHVKSDEYKFNEIPEKKLAAELGFQLVFVPRYYEASTTDLVKKINRLQ
jgi:rfaE bifunctional protein nucleotidyltransferase chain/domain